MLKGNNRLIIAVKIFSDKIFKDGKMYSDPILIKVAELYYQKNMSQKKISEELGVSVSTVSRMLREAIEKGIVRVEIVDISERLVETERELREKFGLKEVIITETLADRNTELLNKQLGRRASELFRRLSRAGDVVGIGSGRTIAEMVESLAPSNPLPGLKLVPLLGGWGTEHVEYEPSGLVTSMGKRLECHFYHLLAPSIVSSLTAKKVLLNEPVIEKVVRLWSDLKSVYFSIGPEITSSLVTSMPSNFIDIQKVSEMGAVGDLLGRIIDAEGFELDIPFNRQLISIPFETLQKVENRVGIGGGVFKYRSIRAVLKRGLINIFVSDYDTCRYILETEE